MEVLDQERRRITVIEERFSQLERRLAKGQHSRVRHKLPATIALVEQAQRLAGHKQREKRLVSLIKRSKFASRQAPLFAGPSTGFTKRLRHRP